VAAITELDIKEEVYIDFQSNFTIHPIKKDLTRLTNEDAVKRSIRNILQTDYYERRFRPKFGANIRAYLFENMTPITLHAIKSAVITAIENHEPRANIIDVVVSGGDNNAVDVTLTFSIINSLQIVSLTTSLALGKVR
jgi:phage baseplate assembly protein W